MHILYLSFCDIDEGSESRKDPDWKTDVMVDVRWCTKVCECELKSG
jgi:hypothetical protein